MSTINDKLFHFTLRSVVEDFIIVFINQIRHLDKRISVGGQLFKNYGQRLGCELGIVVKQHYTSGFDLARHPCDDTFDRRRILPIKTVNIRYKSNILINACALCINMV